MLTTLLGLVLLLAAPLAGLVSAQDWQVVRAERATATQQNREVTYDVLTPSQSAFQVDIGDLNLLIQGMLRASHRIGANDVVVKYLWQEPQANGDVWITLLSRKRIAVRPLDVDTVTRAASAPNGELLSLVLAVAAMSSRVGVFDIPAKCAAEWPSDFVMRDYCQTQQRLALDTLDGRSMTTANERVIRDKCARE